MSETAKKIATAMGLLMSARASEDAAIRILSSLAEEAPVEGVCEHPGDQRKAVATMGDGPDQEFCGACGEQLNP